MKGTLSVWRRLSRLEAQRDAARVAALVARYAAELGCTPSELLAEADALRREAAAAGANTTAALVAFVAADTGIPETELWADLERTPRGWS